MTRARLFREVIVVGASLVLAAVAVGCSEGSGDDDDDGAGSSGTTGASGAGGSGTSGAGGATSATGGASGSSGAATGGTSAIVPDTVYAFDADLEGFAVTYTENIDMADATLTWSSAEGSPDAGALQLEAPITDVDQKVQVSLSLDAPTDLTGQTVVARVRLTSGLNSSPDNPGGAMLFVKTGDAWVWADGGWTNLDAASGWTQLTLNADAPIYQDAATYDPTQVVEIGVQIASGSTGAYEAVVAHIDTIGY